MSVGSRAIFVRTCFFKPPFSDVPNIEKEPTLEPFEIAPRIFSAVEDTKYELELDFLKWIKDRWLVGGHLLCSDPKLYAAIKAFDAAYLHGRTSSSLLAIWGAIEQLFSPSGGEIRFRVSSLLASYLEPPGERRLELFETIMKLYNQRSIAAHTANEIEHGPLIQTFVIMRNALIKIIENGHVPSQKELEKMLFIFENTVQGDSGEA